MGSRPMHPSSWRKRTQIAVLLAAASVIVLLSVLLPVGLLVIRKHGGSTGGANGSHFSPSGATVSVICEYYPITSRLTVL